MHLQRVGLVKFSSEIMWKGEHGNNKLGSFIGRSLGGPKQSLEVATWFPLTACKSIRGGRCLKERTVKKSSRLFENSELFHIKKGAKIKKLFLRTVKRACFLEKTWSRENTEV